MFIVAELLQLVQQILSLTEIPLHYLLDQRRVHVYSQVMQGNLDCEQSHSISRMHLFSSPVSLVYCTWALGLQM